MNYLAHFFLAYPEPDLVFGNYIGDGVRGSEWKLYSESVQRGIRFHRSIDQFTDSHKSVKAVQQLFYPSQARYSGVVVDVLFDHMLVSNWSRFHTMPIEEFASDCYQLIAHRVEEMPVRSARFFGYMRANDLLNSYGKREGLELVFRGMDGRSSFPTKMVDSVDTYFDHFEEIDQAFQVFFSDLIAHCSAWKKAN